MTGPEGGFPQAAARFSAEVDHALTRARRAAGEARAQSAEFRRRNDELGAQAKKGKLSGVRAGEVSATSADARAQAVEFRGANGLPVAELPDADALMARLPGPPPAAENDDFSQHRVMFDVDDQSAETAAEPDFGRSEENAGIDSPDAEPTRPSDDDEDFSQQRILEDVTVESYRPDGLLDAVFEPGNPDNPRSEG
jgi:hypothetical protein